MHLEEEQFICKNGKKLKIQSIGPTYAEEFLDFMRQVSEETHFMSRYADEIGKSKNDVLAEKERQRILENDERQGMISIFQEESIIGNIAIRSVGKGRKTAHRCNVGLAVRKDYHGYGLGTLLMERAIKFAKDVGYEYMELGVLSDNMPARNLYKKMGFVEGGCFPEAFHLDTGESVDEVLMYKKL